MAAAVEQHVRHLGFFKIFEFRKYAANFPEVTENMHLRDQVGKYFLNKNENNIKIVFFKNFDFFFQTLKLQN